MYRQYEDPYKLEKMLEEAEAELDRARQEDPDDVDRLIDLVNEVESLKERVNFAWQDDEYEENYMRENYPEDYLDSGWDEEWEEEERW